MRTNKTIYFLITMVIILIIVNIFTLGFFVFRGNHPLSTLREDGNPGSYLIEELNFNTEQKALFKEYRQEHHSIVQPMMDQISLEKVRFFSKLRNEQIDSVKIDSLSNGISNIHQKVDVVTFWHFNKIRKMCNEKQKAHFDELIKEGILAKQKGRGKLGNLLE